MDNRLLKNLLFILICLGNIFSAGAQENWKLAKKADGIDVYTLKGDSKFASFKGHMIIEQSIHSFVALLNDLEEYVNWGYNLKKVSSVKKSGDTLLIYYAIAQVPFPYKNREGVYRNLFKWNTKTNTLMVEIETVDGYVEKNKDYVSIKGKGFWKVVVLPAGKLDITFQMQVDPGGAVPAWLSNMFIDETPYHNLTNIRKLITHKKYQNKSYSFIKQP
jgi:hypothetical protein